MCFHSTYSTTLFGNQIPFFMGAMGIFHFDRKSRQEINFNHFFITVFPSFFVPISLNFIGAMLELLES